jgi:hypothetical protein
MFVQHAGKLLLIADYYTNKAAYLANCENKFRPQLHCNGQCILMKKMQKAEKKDAQSPAKKLEWKLEVLSRKSFYKSPEQAPALALVSYGLPQNSGTPIDIRYIVFHPPHA